MQADRANPRGECRIPPSEFRACCGTSPRDCGASSQLERLEYTSVKHSLQEVLSLGICRPSSASALLACRRRLTVVMSQVLDAFEIRQSSNTTSDELAHCQDAVTILVQFLEHDRDDLFRFLRVDFN